jgi:hypothetical protein
VAAKKLKKKIIPKKISKKEKISKADQLLFSAEQIIRNFPEFPRDQISTFVKNEKNRNLTVTNVPRPI